ncbi:MAG TPA: hypothetical protein VFU23_03520, partial [Gemmatimonadales bacterium]|nr:hypothetical protein [Gemmatimonadales bacterium]
GQLRRADLSFSTRKLCPDQARGMFPSLAERDACRQRMLTGQVRVEFGGTLGLTKPMLVLKPAYGESGTVVQADSSRLPLSSRQDLQAELSQMLRYLNSPEAHAPAPRTHFEHTVARVNRTLVSVDSATRGLTTTIHTLHAAMLSKNGLGALALGDSGYRSLRSNLDNLARLTDTSGTLVEHAGLGKILTRSDSTMLLADSTMRAIRAQVDRLAPRIELAVEGTARTIEGAEGTLVSLKAAGEDIQAIKRGAQSAVPVAKKGGLLFGLTQLIVALAGVVYIIP